MLTRQITSYIHSYLSHEFKYVNVSIGKDGDTGPPGPPGPPGSDGTKLHVKM